VVVVEKEVVEVPVEATAVPAVAKDLQPVIFDIGGGRVVAPDLWNYYLPGVKPQKGFHQALLEPNFMVDTQNGKILPWLAEGYTSNEAFDEWTVTWRKGITWSDGMPFTSKDVAFTANMMIDNAPKLTWSGLWKDKVQGVEVIDDVTVKFTTHEPFPRFILDMMTSWWGGGMPIVPEHIWKDQDPTTFTNAADPAKGWPVFTGPYQVTKFSETRFVYERRDDWWGAKAGFKPLPQPEQLIWIAPGPEETRVALMADNRMDSIMDISTGAFVALQARNPKIIGWGDGDKSPSSFVPAGCPRHLTINHVKPWDDIDMRWALNYAIDREEVVRVAYGGDSGPSYFFLPPYGELTGLMEDNRDIIQDRIDVFDPKRAEEIFTRKGYIKGDDGVYVSPEGKSLELTVVALEPNMELKQFSLVLIEQLRRVGVDSLMKVVPASVFYTSLAEGNYDAAAFWRPCGAVLDPHIGFDWFHKRSVVPQGERASTNIIRWSNDEYSRLVDEMALLPMGDPGIEPLFRQATEIWMDELPFIPVTLSRKLVPFNTAHWTGWPTLEDPYFAPQTWHTTAHVIIHNLKAVR
jgi:peptide/nickel transport system substrate-binding protein